MMKRIFIAIASLSLIATGCLKDKDNNYGIPDGEVKGISFPRTQMSFGAQADATPQVIPNVVLGLNVQRATTVPVEYTVVSDPTLLAGTGLTAVPASAFTFQATGTIDPGNYVDTIQASLTNASLLDPNITYGIGFRITATSAGYTIAENSRTLVIAINIKNKYDGKYTGKGYGFLGTVNTTAPYLFSWNCDFDVNLTTTGPAKVDMDAQPLFRGASTTYGFSNVIPAFTFDPITNKVVAVTAAPGSVSMQFPVDGGTYDSRYDPTTKTIYVKFGVNNSATWRIIDTLTYCAPR